MKILVSISYYHPNISGLTIYAKNLSESLAAKHKVKLLTSRHLKKLPTKQTLNKVEINRVWTPAIVGRGPIMPTYFLKATALVVWSDVVNIHIPQFEGLILAGLAKMLGKKVVVTHHCDLSEWPGLINKIAVKLTYASLFVTCRLADKIVVYTKDYAKNSGFLQNFKNKLVYILPPVNVALPRKKVTLSFDSKYRIGFAGRIAQEKGLDILFKTTPFLKKKLGEDFKFYLAGPYNQVVGGGYKNKLNHFIKKYKKHIKFLGPLNKLQMASFYKKLDVLVLPSTEKIESFGFVQVEAMKLGCPVVASEMPGVRMPIILSGMGLTFPLGNTKILAQKITEVVLNKDKFVLSAGKINKIFNYQQTIREYEKLYKSLLKK
jgi:glycosyltransferase involved in cell wall biosynthesis